MKRSTALKEEMRRDLMRVYRQVTSEQRCQHQYDAYKRVVEHEAPRFYVDARWAQQRIAPMLCGDRSVLDNTTPLVRQMYEDLFEVVVRVSQKENCQRSGHGASTTVLYRRTSHEADMERRGKEA